MLFKKTKQAKKTNVSSEDSRTSGRILSSKYSQALKKRLLDLINCYKQFDDSNSPAIPYISAWDDKTKEIWYEFAGHRFINIFNCDPHDLAATFRNSIIDRKIYKYVDMEEEIQREIQTRNELDDTREQLRADARKTGAIDAVYRIKTDGKEDLWLKDLATAEVWIKDRICLSLGCLTIVTKEMRAEEERLEKERLHVLLQMACAVCHELNQPMQNIILYSKLISMDTSKDHPAHSNAEAIKDLVGQMGEITHKITKITEYKTKDYINGIKIVDINESSSVK